VVEVVVMMMAIRFIQVDFAELLSGMKKGDTDAVLVGNERKKVFLSSDSHRLLQSNVAHPLASMVAVLLEPNIDRSDGRSKGLVLKETHSILWNDKDLLLNHEVQDLPAHYKFASASSFRTNSRTEDRTDLVWGIPVGLLFQFPTLLVSYSYPVAKESIIFL
jgi:hypothetical protein